MPRIVRIGIIGTVADRTTGWCPSKSVGVTGNTEGLLMRAGERERCCIVVKNIVNGTGRVTGKTYRIVV